VIEIKLPPLIWRRSETRLSRFVGTRENFFTSSLLLRENVLKNEFAHERDSLQRSLDITTALLQEKNKDMEASKNEVSEIKSFLPCLAMKCRYCGVVLRALQTTLKGVLFQICGLCVLEIALSVSFSLHDFAPSVRAFLFRVLWEDYNSVPKYPELFPCSRGQCSSKKFLQGANFCFSAHAIAQPCINAQPVKRWKACAIHTRY